MNVSIGQRGRVCVAIATLLAILSGCAESNSVRSDQALVADAAADDLLAVTEGVYAAWGSLSQRVVPMAIAERGLQAAVSACMADAGLTYDREDRDVSSLANSPNYETLIAAWWAPPDIVFASQFGYGYMEVRRAVDQAKQSSSFAPSKNQAYDALDDQQKVTYDKRLGECSESALADADNARDVLATADQLIDDLEARIATAIQATDLSDDYRACMDQYGYDVRSPGEIFDELLWPRFAELNAYEVEVGSKAFNEAQSFERLVAEADVRCRLTLAPDLVAMLESVTSEWSISNSATLDELVTYWSSLPS